MSRPRGTELLDALEAGELRVAEPDGSGGWKVHAWIKEAILDIFRTSEVGEIGSDRELWPFVDKRALPPRSFDPGAGVRLVPGGSSVRRGAHLGARTILMPPCYVNVGAFVGEGTLVDSHALVGSCAQIGAGVHLSAGAQIGGVLEPVGARPVIVEDRVLVGGQCGLYEGVRVRESAVLGAGVILTGSSRVFDLVHSRELRAAGGAPLEIPAGAVVVPGTRPARGDFARELGLGVACALIIKYRDASTDRATSLEDALR
ncbi:MAG TPA: 2,3,4,5-tetrahydropyridine-2,6-dicarboxylate N-succinyltransferase [Planctomycetes bacterium]|nr:2,3,4,5-tetrahydropyridine-2,6-dicarboxylate N-succinyltransferase [Planctomycetota bacterium]